jgi:O-antigen/teichoic acid export membrane protein
VRRILRNSTLNLAVQVLQAALNLAVFFVLARRVGQDGLGTYYFWVTLVMLVQLVLEAGLGTLLTCRLAHAAAGWKETAAEAAGLFALVALGSLLACTGLGAAGGWLGGEAAVVLLGAVAGVACAALQAQRFCTGVLRAAEEFGLENAARLLQGALLLALVVGLAGRRDTGAAGALALFAASHVAAAGFLLVGVRRRFGRLGCRPRPARARGWLAESLPLGVGEILRGPTWQLDVLLLGLLQPPALLGIYSVAYRPLWPLYLLPRVVQAAALPCLARIGSGDTAALGRAFAATYRLLWVAGLPLAVLLAACAEPVIVLLAGRPYLEAALPLRLVVGKAVLALLSTQFAFLFTALGRQRVYVRLVLAVLVLEAGLGALLIPAWGYVGAAAGCVAAEAVFTAAGLALCRRYGVAGPDWLELARALPAGALLAVAAWGARGLAWPLLLPVLALATGLYFVLCVPLGALRREEARQLCEALPRPFRRAPAGAAAA